MFLSVERSFELIRLEGGPVDELCNERERGERESDEREVVRGVESD